MLTWRNCRNSKYRFFGWYEDERAEALAKVKEAGRYYCSSCEYEKQCPTMNKGEK